jgi:hypothetical protein
MKTQLTQDKYLVMKSYGRRLEWHCMCNIDDLAKALADYKPTSSKRA